MNKPLPNELWFTILSFLEDRDVQCLSGISSVFFTAALDRRYEKVEILSFDRATVAKLERLQDPFVAKRVRMLLLYTGAVNILSSWQVRDRELGSTLPWRLSRIKSLASHLLPSKAESRAALRAQDSLRPTKMRTDQIIALLARVVPQFVNIKTYFLDWSSIWPLGSDPEPSYLQPIWQTIGKKLRSLHLCIPPRKLQVIASELCLIGSLEELHVTFPAGNDVLDSVPTSSTLTTNMLTLFTQFRNTLKVFAISSFAAFDMSSFFAELGYFPNVRRIRLCLRLRQLQLRDATGLTRFLSDHAFQVERLEVLMSEFLLDGECATFVFPSVPFPRLKSLVLIIDQRFALAPTIPTAITHVLSKLETLLLEERYHSHSDLLAWTTAFSEITRTPNLRRLDISLFSLNKQVIDLLAVTFPLLETLRLRCISVGTMDKMLDPSGFIAEMGPWSYPEWQLRSVYLRVRRRGQPGSVVSEETLLAALVRSIPSIRSTETFRPSRTWIGMG
ncbi:hypothetical protein HGRIS_013625 [Hohenbuehelia grisea]|uniref:F-box domain-containing protein n=1 Tax=Hohenbuehelia grisea TaxID=104357 RepID=A0ABR3IW61_9AGAR